MSRTFLLPLCLLLLPFPLLAQSRRASDTPMGAAVTLAAAEPLAIAVADQKAVVTNATPSGKVLLLAIDRQAAGGYFNQSHYALLSDDAAVDGTVAIPLLHRSTGYSVWIAVDLVTGRHAVLRPAGSPYREISVPAKRGGSASSFSVPGVMLDVAVVRPGIGAWFLAAGDGAEGDTGARGDVSIEFALNDLHALRGTQGAARNLLPHDLIAGINETSREYFVTEVQP